MKKHTVTEIQIYREQLKEAFQDFPIQISLGQNCFAFERYYKNNPKIIERAFFSISKKADLIKFDNFSINLYFMDTDYLVKQLPDNDSKDHTFGPSVYSAYILGQNDVLDKLHDFTNLNYVLDTVKNVYYDKVLNSFDGLNTVHDVCCYYEDIVVKNDKIKRLLVGRGLMPVFYIADGQVLKAERIIKEDIFNCETNLVKLIGLNDILINNKILSRSYKLLEIINSAH